MKISKCLATVVIVSTFWTLPSFAATNFQIHEEAKHTLNMIERAKDPRADIYQVVAAEKILCFSLGRLAGMLTREQAEMIKFDGSLCFFNTVNKYANTIEQINRVLEITK